MTNRDFYKILDAALSNIVNEPSNATFFPNQKQEDRNKSFALLVWFIQFYKSDNSTAARNMQYITDGYGDNACDIIFSTRETGRDEIFYVIQSKWVKAIKENSKIDKEEFNATLTGFSTVLKRTASGNKNEKFNEQYLKLIDHLDKNGKAKFVYFALQEHNPDTDTAIEAFNKEHYPNVELLVIDLNRLKYDYIEREYKGIIAENPLEPNYDLNEIEIPIDIETTGPNEQEQRNLFVFDQLRKSYIFTIKPKTVYDIFEKYRYNLFFKNVRNPLAVSAYNKHISETLLKRPDAFWYFNNGITAITGFIPEIGKGAKTIKIKGLQIINGAQTVHAVYSAYKNAKESEREKIDQNARITFRLIKSSDEQFNLEITRFTNSQNQMEHRDFVSNEALQVRLQKESFQTNYWYEKRRGEFLPAKVQEGAHKIVSNYWFALAYLAFHLQRPVDAAQRHNKLFLRPQEDSEGLYETIFTPDIRFAEILAAYMVWERLSKQNDADIDAIIADNDMPNDAEPELEIDNIRLATLALTKVVLQHYLPLKYPQDSAKPAKAFDIARFIVRAFQENDATQQLAIQKAIAYANRYIIERIKGKDEKKTFDNFQKLLHNPVSYERIKTDFEEAEIDIAAIDAQQQFILTELSEITR